MHSRQQGFTLVELIVVIVILGILAATALPKFVNLQEDARRATVNGIAGALRGGVALVNGKWLAAGTNPASVTIQTGISVTVNGSGFPTADAAGIGVVLQSTDGMTVAHAAGVSTFTPNGGSATCRAEYTAATGTVASVVTTC